MLFRGWWRSSRDRMQTALGSARGGHRRWNLRAEELGPGDDLEAAVHVLDDRRAAFHPVAAIEVPDAEILVDRRVVDMAADHAVGLESLGLGSQCLFEGADVVDGVLHLQLGPFGQRPIRKAEPAADAVEDEIDAD